MALGLLLAAGPEAPAQDPACSLPPPTVYGPEAVRSKETYSISWTRVLNGLLGKNDYYQVERATDAGFTTDVLKVKTTRTSASLPGLPAGSTVVFHRVLVQGSCPGGGVASPATSPVFALHVSDGCAVPGPVAIPTAAPEAPPAYTTYVLTWDAAPAASAGAAAVKTRYRLRRIEGNGARDSVVDGTAAMFTDAPGEYRYQVRAEASCGATGPWSPVRTVAVGPARSGALLLVAEPLPFFAGGLSGQPAVRTFSVRNGGTDVLEVTAVAPPGVLVTPATFPIGPWETVSPTASSQVVPDPDTPVHLAVDLRSTSGSLRVLFDVAQPVSSATVPVSLSGSELVFDEAGDALEIVLENPGETPASIVTSTRAGWLVLSDPAGGAWDRPLAPSERRPVTVAVDRSRRRAETGTEVGTVTVETFGLEGKPAAIATLTVIDDGPPLVLTDASAPSTAPPPKTRLLFASLPNAPDVQGSGRYTADLWLTNFDATTAIPVTLTLTPVGEASGTAMGRRTELTLAPGETRRYRNIVGKMLGRDGAASLEVRSSATTLSATVVAASTPNKVAARGQRVTAPRAGGVAATGQYGFEMRPTAPGEGAKASDPEFVVTGLAHDARRRTNIILTETSGVATDVYVELYDLNGAEVMKDGAPVQIPLTVPANGALQINDADLFPLTSLAPAPYARVSWQPGTPSGSVVPFATVIDNGTQDASLRVGVSTRALSPLAPEGPTVPAAKRPTASSSLPFDGGPAPLLFPVAHATGVPVGAGEQPVWKTRVTLTNVSLDENRAVRLAFVDQNGNAPTPAFIGLNPKFTYTFDDIVKDVFQVADGQSLWGGIKIVATQRPDGSWAEGWSDVDVQTETYTNDPTQPERGDFMTGMEGYSYLHGYSSFQSNLGTVQIEGAETSSRFRTNLILHEVGGAPCTVVVGAYLPGSFVPLATAWVDVPAFGYVSRELFRDVLGLDLRELVDVRVVIRQYAGDGVFMAFASKIDQVTGDPANIFLRPASAGTGR